ncbi:MAG TPA: ethanolamine ammonia-lyase subunit EutC [Candidatus Acidoferrales bacterium]|nr:ethanolamine ammonia-lyase subunit EutC [Candidatus Acidoferrales bacterium]
MSDRHKLTHTTPAFLERLRSRMPARVLADRAGAGYRTATQLELRSAHAAARDAVRTEFDLDKIFNPGFISSFNLFEVSTLAANKDDYLLRPDHGRRCREDAVRTIQARCTPGADLQIVIGDGLSVTAVARQVPQLLPLLFDRTKGRGWTLGQPFVVRYCRVGLMNQIGELLSPRVLVLLIGERPGLATAESLSAYMAFQPRPGHSDAQRNLISNIHAHGVLPESAAERILNLAGQMMTRQESGVTLKEELKSST